MPIKLTPAGEGLLADIREMAALRAEEVNDETIAAVHAFDRYMCRWATKLVDDTAEKLKAAGVGV